ncbi:DUF222 domain-containing protein [Quadrisphaera sp. KR29]|uniref:DUF222 domain-containing protein n=1 Tax=Quadrisphaera sp. KR29 TaxID=3461391 RepID=UPI004043F053
MTWRATEAPHEGDVGALGGGPSDQGWVAHPLAPGALGADPEQARGADPPADHPPLPLTGPLAAALTGARTGADEAARAALHLASTGPHQRVQALQETARLRHVVDAVLLRLTASFTPEDLTALGATSPTDLLLTHTGVDARRASAEVHLAKALTAPVRPLPLLAGRSADSARGATEEDGPVDGDVGGGPAAELGVDLDAERAVGVSSPLAGEGLGRLGAEHAAGRVSTDVAALARRTLESLPRRVQRAHGAEADALMAATLPGLTHPEAVIACEVLAQKLDPARADRGFDPDAIDRRYLHLTVHEDGSVDVRGHLDAVTGAELKAAIDHLAKPDPTVRAPLAGDSDDEPGGPAGAEDAPPPDLDGTEGGGSGGSGGSGGTRRVRSTRDGAGVAVRDERTAPQRRADALGLLVRQGRSADETRGGEPPRVIVTATAEQLGAVPGAGQATCETTRRPLTTTALRHLACSAVVHTVTLSCQGPSAAALALGRSVRLFTPAQRRAVLARDGGCVIPGCTSPPGWWEAHHITEWAAGGPTDVDQCVLLCGRHHLLVTVGVWAVRTVGGVPQVRPPASIDPLQRWLLNPRRALADGAARRVEQLLLLTALPSDPAHPLHDAPRHWRPAPSGGSGRPGPPEQRTEPPEQGTEPPERGTESPRLRDEAPGAPAVPGPPGSDEGPPPDVPVRRSTCRC